MSAAADVRLGDWAALSAHAAPIRRAVFVVEQHIDESLEWDEHDAVSLHAVAWVDGVPVATGRLLPDGRIGRMAVLAAHRGSGIGARVLGRLVDAARARGDASVVLAAQSRVCGFYARHGFEPYGEEFVEAGIPHQWMRRRLRAD